MEPVIEEEKKNINSLLTKFSNKKTFFLAIILGVVLLFSLFCFFIVSPPKNTEYPVSLIIEEGSSLREVTQQLKDLGVIRSRVIANTVVIFDAGDGGVVSGEYLFEVKENLLSVAKRITRGEFGINAVQVTIPEGATIEDIGIIFENRFEQFDKEKFYELAKDKEGYLFPDTYIFLENVKEKEVIETLEENFSKKTKSIEEELINYGMALEEVVVMASIIEKESTAEARQDVSNVLWNRMSIGMALQVDATFVYSIGKGTFDLHMDDLEDSTNTYNTYTHTGLPPTAIGNPGLEAIKAAANPQPTENLYFLTGRDGEMYYAETFTGHKENRRLYLD